MTVRMAKPSDRDALVAMGTEFLAASPHAAGTPDPQRIAMAVDSVLQHGFACVAQDRDGAAVGMLGCLVGPHPLTGVLTAFEVAWYLHPSNRGGTAAKRLVDAAEIAARDHFAVRIQIGAPDGRVGVFLERAGYWCVETQFAKELR